MVPAKLTGKLVHLRAQDMDDLDRYVAWMNDAEVTRWIGDQARYPFSRQAEIDWLERQVSNAPGPESVSLAIETLDGTHIGSTGLSRIGFEARHAELGILIGDRNYWSRGYGTDAIRTLLRFAFDEMNLHRVYLGVDADNERAIACYRKCGFIEEGRHKQHHFRAGNYIDTLTMAVLADEYRALRSSWEARPG